MKKISLYSLSLALSLIGFSSLSSCAALNGSRGISSEAPVVRNVYAMPAAGNDIVGNLYRIKVKKGMTFDGLAQKYDIGAQELMDANPGVKPYRIRIGSRLTIPSEYILPPEKYRKGIVINIAERRLYYFDKADNSVMTFPVAVGRQGWRTPLGRTYVYRKEEGPTWNVPKSIRDSYLEKTGEAHPRRIGPGPKNPLGDYAIFLHMDGYLIHGTNDPASIGRSVSSGCIRMLNQDVAELYHFVKRGTPVAIIYYPNKAGWRNGRLYLESHTPQQHKDGVHRADGATAIQAVREALEQHPEEVNRREVNWRKIKKVVRRHSGVPTLIGREIGTKNG